MDVAWFLRRSFQLATKVLHVHVDGSLVALVSITLDLVEQLHAGEHAARGSPPSPTTNRIPSRSDRPRRRPPARPGGRGRWSVRRRRWVTARCLSCPRRGVGAPAREPAQLARGENGLGDVIIGAQLQAHQFVGLFYACGQYNDRHVRFPSDGPGHIQAVESGQPQVQDHQAGVLVAKGHQCCLTVGRSRNSIARRFPDRRGRSLRSSARHPRRGFLSSS